MIYRTISVKLALLYYGNKRERSPKLLHELLFSETNYSHKIVVHQNDNLVFTLVSHKRLKKEETYMSVLS